MYRTLFAMSLLCLIAGIAAGADESYFMAPVTGMAGQVAAADFYWISFGGDHNGDSYFLMQIDSAGNVVKPPKAVIACVKVGACKKAGATALSKNGAGKLNYWVFGNDVLYRVLISKTTLLPVGLKKFNVTTNDDDGLQVTQKPSGNFIILEQPPHILKGYTVTPAGIGTANWAIAPQAPSSNDEGSVSADGRFATTNRNNPDLPAPPPDQLFLQPLTTTGRPQGAPIPMVSAQDIEASDVSNALSSGNRFVVYMNDTNNAVRLQVVGPAGAKIGTPTTIRGSARRDVDDQTIAIDPLGRFVVFTLGGGAFGCLNHDVLVYQAINGTGHKVGPLKVLARCGFVDDDILNIDILKE